MGETVAGTLAVFGVALVVAPIAVLIVAPPIAAERAAHRLWLRVRTRLGRSHGSRRVGRKLWGRA